MDTGDFFHYEEEWNTHHNSGWRDGKSDWQPREELTEMLAHMKQAWEESRRYKRQFLENYVKEHGHLPWEIPEWKLKAILKRRGLDVQP